MKNKIIDAIFIIDNFLYKYHLHEEDKENLQILLNDCKKRYKFEERKHICKNCGKPFIAYNRANTLYCDRISPQNPAKTCKQYGREKAWLDRIKDENDWYSLYRKIYQVFQKKAIRNPEHKESQKLFDDFRTESTKWKKAVKEGTKTEEEFMKWLQTFRKI